MATETMPAPAITFSELDWIIDNPSTLSCPAKKATAGKKFHGRRSHRKSRNGCLTCKKRHVKCDETKPKCQKCIQQRIKCEYPKSPTPPDTESDDSADSPWSSAVTTSMAADIVETQLRGILKPWAKDTPRRPALAHQAAGSLIEVLQHFESIAWSTIGSLKIQHLMKTKVPSLAQGSPFLMNAIFAFSALHLCTLHPDDRKVRMASMQHSQMALKLYTQELNGPITLDKIDAMIAACLLVSALIFFNDECCPSSSFVFSDDPHAADWLSAVGGLSVLLNKEDSKPVISKSIWMPVFTGNNHCIFPELISGHEGLHEKFTELCHIQADSTCDNNPYHGELRLLSSVMLVPSNTENFSTIIQFPCRMQSSFNTLIREKDPVALLMLAYWFAKMTQIDYWWLQQRARTECYAICSYLDGWPDPRFQYLLQYPMKACGYIPIDLDMIESYVFGM